MSAAIRSSIYAGRVWHVRDEAPAHAFGLDTYFLHLDLGELPRLSREIPLLGLDRPRLVEVRHRDHFRGHARTLRARLEETLEAHGVAAPDGPVSVLTQGRVLGHVFNPVSFWWCRQGDGRLAAAVAEVHNTYGDRHAYVLPGADSTPGTFGPEWTTKKRMHVSPFFDLEGSYRFEVGEPGPTLRIDADLKRAGRARIRAGFNGERIPLTEATLARFLLSMPVMPWRIWTKIHWKALSIWRSGARFHPRPPYDPVAAGLLPS
jgi:DUF1365 family protein